MGGSGVQCSSECYPLDPLAVQEFGLRWLGIGGEPSEKSNGGGGGIKGILHLLGVDKGPRGGGRGIGWCSQSRGFFRKLDIFR